MPGAAFLSERNVERSSRSDRKAAPAFIDRRRARMLNTCIRRNGSSPPKANQSPSRRKTTLCWRRAYNRFRPHSSLGYRPPAPEVLEPRTFTSPEISLVAHNLAFDLGVVGAELVRLNKRLRFLDLPGLCTMETTTEVCCLPRWGSAGFKWPTLVELHVHLFGRSYDRPHDAVGDLEACARCFFKLLGDGYYRLPPSKR